MQGVGACPRLARQLIVALAVTLSCTHKKEAEEVAQVRRALSEPHLDAQGNYIVTPGELVRSMSQAAAAFRWLGASVHLTGVAVHVGTPEEARVRGLNDGKAFVVIGDSGADPASRPGSLPVAVCELDSSTVPPIVAGDSVEAYGEVSGVAGPTAADLQCTSIRRRSVRGNSSRSGEKGGRRLQGSRN